MQRFEAPCSSLVDSRDCAVLRELEALHNRQRDRTVSHDDHSQRSGDGAEQRKEKPREHDKDIDRGRKLSYQHQCGFNKYSCVVSVRGKRDKRHNLCASDRR